MKINKRCRSICRVAWLALTLLLLVVRAQALDVVDPTGANYTSVSDSSEYSSQYAGASLFNEDVTGISLGSVLTGGQWATAGQATAFLAFQVEKVYTNIGSIFYAQRAGGSPTLDKINTISIWVSATTPFSPSDPGTPPNAVVQITNQAGALWEEYLLTNQISGQYFLIEIAQSSAPTVEGNPGGTQFRLGGVFTPELTYSSSSAGLTLKWPIGVTVTLQQAPTVSGPWTPATGVTNGAPIPFPALENQQTFYRLKY